jgi:hypothetical protein
MMEMFAYAGRAVLLNARALRLGRTKKRGLRANIMIEQSPRFSVPAFGR